MCSRGKSIRRAFTGEGTLVAGMPVVRAEGFDGVAEFSSGIEEARVDGVEGVEAHAAGPARGADDLLELAAGEVSPEELAGDEAYAALSEVGDADVLEASIGGEVLADDEAVALEELEHAADGGA